METKQLKGIPVFFQPGMEDKGGEITKDRQDQMLLVGML
jgi:hypothetical protein